MGWISLVTLIISLTQGLLAGLTAANAPQAVLAAAQTAIAELRKVHSELVTKAQVDSITLDYKW